MGSGCTLKWLTGLLEGYPLDLKVLVTLRWFVIPFSSIKATFKASSGDRVSVRSFRWMSEFFILLINISRIHSSSPVGMSHLFAISASAPQNCSSDSLSLCFLFNSLCISKVMFVFLTKAIDKFSQNSLKEICGTLNFVNFWANIIFLRFRGPNKVWTWVFCPPLLFSCCWIS